MVELGQLSVGKSRLRPWALEQKVGEREDSRMVPVPKTTSLTSKFYLGLSVLVFPRGDHQCE